MTNEEQVVNDLSEHINTLGQSVKVLLDYVKAQDDMIRTMSMFLTSKYGNEYDDHILNNIKKD